MTLSRMALWTQSGLMMRQVQFISRTKDAAIPVACVEAIPQNAGIHGSISRKTTTKNELRIQFIRRTNDAATQAVCAGYVRGDYS